MILQALAKYYDQLLEGKPEEIAHPGWCERPVIARLELDEEGGLVNIIPAPEKRGWTLTVPNQVKRAYGIVPNLLCDTSSYLLGIDEKGKPERTLRCFEASRQRHEQCLEGLDCPYAKAVRGFFATWDPLRERENPLVQEHAARILAGGLLVFSLEGEDVLSDPAIRRRVEELAFSPADDAQPMVCLVSGERVPIARLHPSIKGVAGAQSSGASLVSFNSRAFESYGRQGEQGLNSPVGEASAFAYTTALNYLIAHDDHRLRLGDTTIVYWAERQDAECAGMVSSLLGGLGRRDREKQSKEDADLKLGSILKLLRSGRLADSVDMDVPFYVLGLAPNASRLAVRFFLASTFGDVVANLAAHYGRIEICHNPNAYEFLTPYQLIRETENPKAKQKSASSILAGALMRSILTNDRYPEALLANVLLRVHASSGDQRKVTRGRAAIIKAYLIKNCGKSEKEVTVALDEGNIYPPYLLGRLLAVLNAIQYADDKSITVGIEDKYFDSASTTPAVVFPVVFRIARAHLKKLKRDKPGLAHYFQSQIDDIMSVVGPFPKRLSIEEQCEFIRGFYQQNSYRSNKKDTEEA